MRFSKFKAITMCLLIAIAARGAFAGSQCKTFFAVQNDRLTTEGCTTGFCAAGTFTGNHGFNGNFFFTGLPFETILSDPLKRQVVPGISTYTTADGSLTISDVSVFDSDAEHRTFAGIGRITAGTGRFAGATGDVFTTGRVGADGVSFTTDMTAQICFPN